MSAPAVAHVRTPVRPRRIWPKVLFVLAALVGIFAAAAIRYQLWLFHSAPVIFAREMVVNDPRVQAEFGRDVHFRYVLGWPGSDDANFSAAVVGAEGQGTVYAQLHRRNGSWNAQRMELFNEAEAHVINFSPPPPVVGVGQLHGFGRLYLVPLGAGASDEVNDLAEFLRNDFNVPVQVLPAVAPSELARDKGPRRWIGEMLVDDVASHYPQISTDEDASTIAVIDDDMSLRTLGMDYSFNFRRGSRFAVIAGARLDPGFYGLKPSPIIKRERLKKVLLKDVGDYYFHFPDTQNAASVMLYGRDLTEIDRMSGQYLQSVEGQLKLDGQDGKPCLGFSTANILGTPRVQAVRSCIDSDSFTAESHYVVDLSTGELRATHMDLYRSGPAELFLERTQYNRTYGDIMPAFGRGSHDNFDDGVASTDTGSMQTVIIQGVTFVRVTPGVGFSTTARWVAPDNSGEFSNATLSFQRAMWEVDTQDGGMWRYIICPPDDICYFMEKTNPAGDQVRVSRNPDKHIVKVTEATKDDLAAKRRKTTL